MYIPNAVQPSMDWLTLFENSYEERMNFILKQLDVYRFFEKIAIHVVLIKDDNCSVSVESSINVKTKPFNYHRQLVGLKDGQAMTKELIKKKLLSNLTSDARIRSCFISATASYVACDQVGVR